MSDQTPAGQARIIKTKRVQHVLTTNEVAAFNAVIEVVWDTPFTDLNYTCDQNLEIVSTAAGLGDFYVNSFTRTVNGVTVGIGISGSVAAGDVVALHAHAIRD
jgi:hypothetical protein